MSQGTVTPLRLRKPAIGRPSASQGADWRDEATALLNERLELRATAKALLPRARYLHLVQDDVQAEQTAAVIWMFINKVAGPKDVA